MYVTPFAGVWIEIPFYKDIATTAPSLPSRECGLKFQSLDTVFFTISVTPFAGVWIEIFDNTHVLLL